MRGETEYRKVLQYLDKLEMFGMKLGLRNITVAKWKPEYAEKIERIRKQKGYCFKNINELRKHIEGR